MWRFFARWQARLPSPFTAADRAAGHGYDLAFRQFEVFDTRVRERPCELLHMDVKKLGRIPDGGGQRFRGRGHGTSRAHRGYDYIHQVVDDMSRVAYALIYPDERGTMTDNARNYTTSRAFADVLTEVGARHLTTQPFRPQTNGKSERFNRTLLDEWAYARAYTSNNERLLAFGPWLHQYNHHRPTPRWEGSLRWRSLSTTCPGITARRPSVTLMRAIWLAARAALVPFLLMIATACAAPVPSSGPGPNCEKTVVEAVLHVIGGDPRQTWGTDLDGRRDINVRPRPHLGWVVNPISSRQLVDASGRLVTFDGEIFRQACFEASTNTYFVGPEDLPDPHRQPG